MAISALTAIAAICTSMAAPQPVGSYRADLSRVPRASLGVLKAVFGRSVLRVSPDGKFAFCGIRQSGFWRIHQGRLVLVYEGFMGTPFAVPDEVLKKTWPDDEVSGPVLSFKGQNRLELSKFGRVARPILFVRQPSRDTKTLLAESNRDEMDALVEEAYTQLADEMPTRWREVKTAINDPKIPARLRLWASVIWHGPPTEEVALGMIDLCETQNSKGVTERQALSIRRAIARNLARFATKPIVSRMLALDSKGLVPRPELAEAIARTLHHAAKPQLRDWLQSKGSYDRGTACEALAKLGAKDALPSIRRLVQDTEARARIGALTAVATLSDDAIEQGKAIAELAKELRGDWLDACNAVEGLGATRSRLAVRPLIAALASSQVLFVRRDAATQLGILGFPEAIPALLDAKTGSPLSWIETLTPEVRGDADFAKVEKILGRSMEEAPVRKAAAEALWLFDKRGKS